MIRKNKNWIYFLPILIFVFFSLFLVKDIFRNTLSGTFSAHTVPSEYIELNKELKNEQSFFRTLWIPQVQRFGDFSYEKPAIWGNHFLETIDLQKQTSILRNPSVQKRIEEAGIKYIIVPYDSEGEIFLKDREYSEQIYRKTVSDIEKIPWIVGKKSFGKITVFEVPNPKDRFWTENNTKLEWKMINPTHYQVRVAEGEINGLLVFSDGFDPNWIARFGENKIYSKKYNEYFNSFYINSESIIDVYYQPQELIKYGFLISVLSLIAFCVLLIKYRK